MHFSTLCTNIPSKYVILQFIRRNKSILKHIKQKHLAVVNHTTANPDQLSNQKIQYSITMHHMQVVFQYCIIKKSLILNLIYTIIKLITLKLHKNNKQK